MENHKEKEEVLKKILEGPNRLKGVGCFQEKGKVLSREGCKAGSP